MGRGRDREGKIGGASGDGVRGGRWGDRVWVRRMEMGTGWGGMGFSRDGKRSDGLSASTLLMYFFTFAVRSYNQCDHAVTYLLNKPYACVTDSAHFHPVVNFKQRR